jgi:RNA polymerase sigma-70 factor (ECF subfamily)
MVDRLGAQPGPDDSAPGPEPGTSDDRFLRDLDAARAGDLQALGQAMEPFRQFLLMVAERELGQDLKVKEGASDLVQETLLEAHQHFGQFAGRSQDEFRAWLRRMLRHRVSYTARRYRKAGKRRLGRERSIGATDSSQGLADWLAGDSTSPSGRAVRGEEEAAVLAALDRLPERMRQAIIWKHREDCSFEEIGRRLGRSDVAARRLWVRAIEKLRQELNISPDRADDLA